MWQMSAIAFLLYYDVNYLGRINEILRVVSTIRGINGLPVGSVAETTVVSGVESSGRASLGF